MISIKHNIHSLFFHQTLIQIDILIYKTLFPLLQLLFNQVTFIQHNILSLFFHQTLIQIDILIYKTLFPLLQLLFNQVTFIRGVPGFYILVPDLQQEIDVVDYSVRAYDLGRDIQRKYTILEKIIQTAWDKYMNGDITTSHFLKVFINQQTTIKYSFVFESTVAHVVVGKNR
jgi:hypothetical protein